MPQKEDATIDDGGSVNIGTTGTIGSLMTREIESMKRSEQASSSAQRKQQTGSVSVPCGANPRKALQRRNQTNEYGSTGSSSSGTGHTHCSNQEDAQKSRHTPRKKGHRHAPILRSDDSPTNRNLDTDKVEKKSSHLHGESSRSKVRQSHEQPAQEAELLQALRIHLLALGQFLPISPRVPVAASSSSLDSACLSNIHGRTDTGKKSSGGCHLLFLISNCCTWAWLLLRSSTGGGYIYAHFMLFLVGDLMAV